MNKGALSGFRAVLGSELWDMVEDEHLRQPKGPDQCGQGLLNSALPVELFPDDPAGIEAPRRLDA